jgi:hypothetical protein
MGFPRRVAAAVAVGVPAALVAGWSAAGGVAGERGQAGPTTVVGVACSRAVDYKSLAQLRRAAASVAVIEPTGAIRRRRVAGLPIQVATVTVVEVVAGQALPRALTVRDVADPRITGDADCADRLQGQRLSRVSDASRLRRGGYDVVGGPHELFAHAGVPPPSDPTDRSFIRTDPEPGSALSGRISIADA